MVHPSCFPVYYFNLQLVPSGLTSVLYNIAQTHMKKEFNTGTVTHVPLINDLTMQ